MGWTPIKYIAVLLLTALSKPFYALMSLLGKLGLWPERDPDDTDGDGQYG